MEDDQGRVPYKTLLLWAEFQLQSSLLGLLLGNVYPKIGDLDICTASFTSLGLKSTGSGVTSISPDASGEQTWLQQPDDCRQNVGCTTIRLGNQDRDFGLLSAPLLNKNAISRVHFKQVTELRETFRNESLVIAVIEI